MSRLAEIVASIEMGEQVDYGRVLQLQALDAAIAGEEFVRQSVARQEKADGQLATALGVN